MNTLESEIKEGRRFEFGENWLLFLRSVNEERINQAIHSLCDMLSVTTLEGKNFLDIGCGSGLFSLAARRLGAEVYSLDYDPQSVACADELKKRYFPNDAQWTIQKGSVLDLDYLKSLGKFDVVYSWGVLHHTGAMWQALDNARIPVRDRGSLFIAIYNDQGRGSTYWTLVKRIYNALPVRFRFLILWPSFVRLWGPSMLRDVFKGQPMRSWRGYFENRGMTPWRDVVDWVGGYPFEVAKPDRIFDFYMERSFALEKLKTCGGGLGCNEYVFRKMG